MGTILFAGTTWMLEIMYLLKTDGDTIKADSVPVFISVPYMESPYPQYHDSEVARDNHKFYKSHLPFHMLPKNIKQKKAKIVIVHRDHRDVAVSLYHFYRMNEYLVSSVMLGSV